MAIIYRFKYRGDDDSLKGCELVDLSFEPTRIFPFQGVAFKYPFEPPIACTPIPICKVYYISWVGLLKDWSMTKTRLSIFSE